MKTICYVDGFNLYYGCLKGTDYKWLDVYKLFFRIVHENNPAADLLQIKFFTAPIKTKLATHGNAAGIAQDDHHRALQILYPNKIMFLKGYFACEKAELLEYIDPPDKARRVNVWRLEEKQSDVNIAIEAYRDAARGVIDQAIFVTNDTDQQPTLKALWEDFPSLKIGVVLPIRQIEPTIKTKSRPGNAKLSLYADWTRNHILDVELSGSLLPDVVPTKKKPIRKPEYW